MNYENTLRGHCHCGNIEFKIHTNREIADFTPRTCQCSLCKHHGASWISDPEGHLDIHYKNTDDIQPYRFGHKTADFILCKKCGVMPFALCEIEGRTRAVINILTMLETSFTAEPIQTVFDTENVDSRLERRGKNWTGTVTTNQ